MTIDALAVKSFPGRAKPSRFSPPHAKDLPVNGIAAGPPQGLLVPCQATQSTACANTDGEVTVEFSRENLL